MNNLNDLDNELDLVSFISILSLCICFLLVSVIWIQVGSMTVQQAVGGGVAGAPRSSFQTDVKENGTIKVVLKNVSGVKRSLRRKKIEPIEGKINEEALKEYIAQVLEKAPKMNTALIQPSANTNYETIINVMDVYRQAKVSDLGIVPL